MTLHALRWEMGKRLKTKEIQHQEAYRYSGEHNRKIKETKIMWTLILCFYASLLYKENWDVSKQKKWQTMLGYQSTKETPI